MADEIEIYRKKLERERNARQQAEELLEQKSLALDSETRERELAISALRESEERYRLLVELSPDAILVASGNRIVFANSSACQLFQAKRPDELEGRAPLDFVAPAYQDSARATMDKLAQDGTSVTVEEKAVRPDGGLLDVMVTRLAITYQGKAAVQIVLRDISERKRLDHQASHDPLTGLPNRDFFMDRLHYTIADARQFVIAFLDLDRFKWVNDTLGHDVGDQLLKTVAKRLSGCLRETDTAARLGGDEFVLLPGISLRDQARPVLDRVVAAISQPAMLNGHEVAVTCSLGCSSYPEDGHSADELLRYADAAMYNAKEAGRNKLQEYDENLRQSLNARLRLESELRHAIDRRQLSLHYQPQVDLRNGDILGVEALLRWRHPTLGQIEPGRFIPLAEATGLIVPIDEWVMRQACTQLKSWQQAELPAIRMAVKVSAKQFNRPGLVQLVSECLAANGLHPACLELEITESTMMQDLNHAIPLLHELKRIGVELAIDDFGTGFSNMQYLYRLPLDKLKLDGSFVSRIMHDPGSFAIADAIITLSHRLGLKVIAEQPESEGQILLLTARGCDQAQGYYFSRPLPEDQLAKLLAAGRSLPLPASAQPGSDRTLLVLDDDPDVISALRRVLHSESYRLLLTSDVKEAFELLACNAVGVVLCDQRLGDGYQGVEFLHTAKALYPSTVRLILSGYRDFDAASAAINRSAVHKFISKPWQNKELRKTLAEAFEHHERMLAESGRSLSEQGAGIGGTAGTLPDKPATSSPG